MRYLRLSAICLTLRLVALLAVGREAWADWSVPVLLWEDQPGGFELFGSDAAIAVDAQENVHVVFTHMYVSALFPQGPPLTQVSYCKFDPWGQQLVSETMVSDSSASCSYPRIALFGMDSLWVVWFSSEHGGLRSGFYTRSLDLNGNPLCPVALWSDSMAGSPFGYALDVLPDRSVVLAFSDVRPIIKTILMIHQRPDGTRILDHVPIFRDTTNGEGTDGVAGYADTTRDSLQIIWREAHLDVWQAVFAKRASLHSPAVDTTVLGDHVALTPTTPGSVRDPGRGIRGLGDSLFLYNELRNDIGIDESYLHVLRRSDYNPVATAWIGANNYHQWGIEQDGRSVSSVGNNDPAHTSAECFSRFSLPDLAEIEDTVLAQNHYGQNIDYSLDYTVSPGGARLLVYQRAVPPFYSTHQLYYRCWRSDLAVGPTPQGTGHAKAGYTVAPNPSAGHFTIEGPLAKATSIILYNVLGQQVGREISGHALQGRTLSYSTDDLPNGVYFLHIATPAGTTIRKVLVVR